MKNQCNMAYMAMYNLKMNTYNILNKVPNVSSLRLKYMLQLIQPATLNFAPN